MAMEASLWMSTSLSTGSMRGVTANILKWTDGKRDRGLIYSAVIHKKEQMMAYLQKHGWVPQRWSRIELTFSVWGVEGLVSLDEDVARLEGHHDDFLQQAVGELSE